MNNLRLLIIANQSTETHWMEDLLASDPLTRQMTCTWADRLKSGLSYLREGSYDAALIDLELPDSHGLDTIHRLHKGCSTIPVIVLAVRE